MKSGKAIRFTKLIFSLIIIGIIGNSYEVKAILGWGECPVIAKPEIPLDVAKLTTGTWFEVVRDAGFEDDM